MAETMVERVARAICASRNGPGAKPWSLLPKAHKAPYLGDARAAIEALREPTADMCNAGADKLDTFDPADRCPSPWDMERGYRAMIDAILKEE